VVIATGHPRRVYTCDGYNGLDRHGRPLDLPVIVDVTDTWATKTAALAAHVSQPIGGHFGPMADALARLHGRRIERPLAEAFRPVPVLGRLPATRSYDRHVRTGASTFFSTSKLLEAPTQLGRVGVVVIIETSFWVMLYTLRPVGRGGCDGRASWDPAFGTTDGQE
jgi:hypothetical protein